MCTPSVSPEFPSRLDAENAADDALALWFPRSPAPPRESSRSSGGRDARAERPGADARDRSDSEWGSLDAALDLVELGSTCAAGWTDRRIGARVASLLLTDADRSAARSLTSASLSCGASLKAFHSWRPGTGYGAILRLVAQLHCGTRACGACQGKMREAAKQRMAIEARMFLTFTIPPIDGGVRAAWKLLPEKQAKMNAIIRREANYRNREITGATEAKRERLRARRTLARSRLRGAYGLDYSWAREPQKSGMPHVHMLVSFAYVDYSWIREIWGKLWGVQMPNVQGDPVKSINGACWYLTTYVAKQKTSLDILSIMKRKRMWASTKKKEPSVGTKWIEDDRTSEAGARWQVNNRDEAGAESGWTLESGADDRYALWSMPARFPWMLGECKDALSVVDKSGDYSIDYDIAFKLMMADRDNSIIIEEYICEKLYGKKRANKISPA